MIVDLLRSPLTLSVALVQQSIWRSVSFRTSSPVNYFRFNLMLEYIATRCQV